MCRDRSYEREREKFSYSSLVFGNVFRGTDGNVDEASQLP